MEKKKKKKRRTPLALNGRYVCLSLTIKGSRRVFVYVSSLLIWRAPNGLHGEADESIFAGGIYRRQYGTGGHVTYASASGRLIYSMPSS